MTRRVARRGPNAGNPFWGCSSFPDCRGTRDIGPGDHDVEDSSAAAGTDETGAVGEAESPREAEEAAATQPLPVPVSWRVAAPRNYVAEYAAVSAFPGVLAGGLGLDERLRSAIGQCVVYSRRDRDRGGGRPQARLVGGLLVKLLQRGRLPLPTLEIERAALAVHGLADRADDLSADGVELGWQAPGVLDALDRDSLLRVACRRAPFELASGVDFDPNAASQGARIGSTVERRFLCDWVPKALDPSAGQWFTPQAPLDQLARSLAGSEKRSEDVAARRVDFLYCHPGGTQFVVELDGPEHESAWEDDEERDRLLEACRIEVVRVGNEEVECGRGRGLKRVRALHDQAVSEDDREADPLAAMILDCAEAARVQFAIARAVGYGWLDASREWRIELSGAGEVAAAGVRDALTILAALDVLHGGRTAPRRCRIVGVLGQGEVELAIWERPAFVDVDTADDLDRERPPQRLRIETNRLAGPFHRLEGSDADFVIRPTCLPVVLATDNPASFARSAIAPESAEEATPALRVFLQNVFRKCEFREKQDLAVFQAMKQRDCVVLLPTGAGKSLVYQMAGLLMPGTTLVVDPIIALMEDQVDGLRRYGMDRAEAISSAVEEGEQTRLLDRLAGGEIQFLLLTPERVQTPRFRQTLAAMKRVSPVNLAVIDEAHCVSEWGHDFRPAYLSLARSLRRLGADRSGAPPPILAMTGTASRAVLRDMLEAVGIDGESSDALIRPDSFDRRELRFAIDRTKPGKAAAVFRGLLKSLPAEWNWPAADFFSAAAAGTKSGIVFVPHVNGQSGVAEVGRLVEETVGAAQESYSGKPPKGFGGDWDVQKRQNARAFKRNEIPVLIATKAFGMGIDKPNIRYTIHYGMPQSLENFYQEAGRAGRDRKPALCSVVFTEYDAGRTDWLLDPNAGLEELRERYAQDQGNWKKKDDVMNVLFFHFGAFAGQEQEIRDVQTVLDLLGDLAAREEIQVPFDWEETSREKALYRLVRLGVVHDYEVEWGSKRFKVDVARFDLEAAKGALLRYVETTQPARVPVFEQRLDEVGPGSPVQCALALANLLIGFTYDVIERSRRRMIQESMLLARSANTDLEIRRRLLDYLSEGFGAEQIEELLRDTGIDLAGWFDLFGNVQSPLEAGELRGLCIRFLESFPDHPALLLVRAAAEARCSDHDEAASSRGVEAAIRVGLERYELPRRDVQRAIDWLFDPTRGASAPALGRPAARALLGLWQDVDLRWVADHVLEAADRFDNAGLREETLTWRLERAVERAAAAVDATEQRWAAAPSGRPPPGRPRVARRQGTTEGSSWT